VDRRRDHLDSGISGIRSWEADNDMKSLKPRNPGVWFSRNP